MVLKWDKIETLINCGCVLSLDVATDQMSVHYCPLHAAAPLMLEALKALIGALGLRRPKSELVEDYGMLGLDAIQHSWDVIAAATKEVNDE